jgi:hypothetical protein
MIHYKHVAFTLIHAISRRVVEHIPAGVAHVRCELPVMAQAKLAHGNTTEEHAFDPLRICARIVIRVIRAVGELDSLIEA